ncbi:MAG: heparinase II/III family protein, partial [Victivallaceae bacterium]
MNMRTKSLLLAVALSVGGNLMSQELRNEVFSLLNLDQPGLEKVKSLHDAGNDKEAAAALLDYYRNRTHINHPDVDLNNISISEKEQKWADDAMEHTFFVHKGYQPSYNYGKDINWQYWPVEDNELRWQLHRHKWFSPMGKAYRTSGNEKYAKE